MFQYLTIIFKCYFSYLNLNSKMYVSNKIKLFHQCFLFLYHEINKKTVLAFLKSIFSLFSALMLIIMKNTNQKIIKFVRC